MWCVKQEDLMSSLWLQCVIPGDILSFTMYWTILLLQSPTKSPEQVTWRKTGLHRNPIFTPRSVCVWISAGKTYVFSWLNDAWSTCQLASVLITVTQKNWDTQWTDKEEKTMKVRKSKRKLHFLPSMRRSLLPYRPPHVSSWHILSDQQDPWSGHNNVLH